MIPPVWTRQIIFIFVGLENLRGQKTLGTEANGEQGETILRSFAKQFVLTEPKSTRSLSDNHFLINAARFR